MRRFFAYYRPHWRLFAMDFSCAVISGLLELGFPMAVRAFIDRLLPGQNWGLILLASAALLAIYLVNTGLMVVVTYWGHMLGINIETEMRRRAFDHLQKLSFRFYDNQKTGHLVARVTKDLEEVGEVAHHGPEDLFIAVMTFVGAFALMFVVNARLALLTTLVVPATAFLAARYGNRMTQTFRALFNRVGQFNVRIEENVGGMRVVQAFANEDHERALFAVDNQRYRQTKLEAYRIMAASTSLSYLSMRLTQIVVMVAGTWFVLHGQVVKRRLHQLPAADRGVLPPGREDQRGAGGPTRKASPGSAATPSCWTPSRTSWTRLPPSRSAACAATSATKASPSATAPVPRCSATSTCTSRPGRRWRSSGRRAPARRRCARCCRGSTTRWAGASPSTASTSAP